VRTPLAGPGDVVTETLRAAFSACGALKAARVVAEIDLRAGLDRYVEQLPIDLPHRARRRRGRMVASATAGEQRRDCRECEQASHDAA
jgi:hypothetical protein